MTDKITEPAMTELTPKEDQKIKELAVDYFEGNPLGLPPRQNVTEGMREALEDVRTHKNAWREALVETRDRAINDYPDINNTGYWQHELDASADTARDRATRIAARPSLSKLVSDGHLSFEELGIIRDEIAAAIREDRAEPVSDEEVEAACKAFVASEPRCAFFNTSMRAALEAARQVRATADEKGGAR